MLVMKFGGTSLGTADNIKRAISLIQKELARKPVVVVSAVATVTNTLIALGTSASIGFGDCEFSYIVDLHHGLLNALSLPDTLLDVLIHDLSALTHLTRNEKATNAERQDAFMAFGELFSAKIVASLLNQNGTPAQDFPSWSLGMVTDRQFGDAEILANTYPQLKKSLSSLEVIPIITGFIAKSSDGEVTTLGRGGSDYTAAIIGAAIEAEMIQIWTDVDGIMTTDPSIVPGAKTIPLLAFEEACELAYFGAKVLHPKMLLPAMTKDIPVQVLNTFNPDQPGTTIKRIIPQNWPKGYMVGAFSYKKGTIAIHVRSPHFYDGNDIMAEIFRIFERAHTIIDVVATSVVSVSLITGDSRYLTQILSELEKFGQVEVIKNKAVVCAVGGGMNAAGVAGRLFSLLGQHGIKVEMISQASSGVSITFVVDDNDAKNAITLLHQEYIEKTK